MPASVSVTTMSKFPPPERSVRCISRDGKEKGILTGGRRCCALEGCTGVRLGVRWPDGKLTWPCTDGMKLRGNGDWVLV